MSFNINEISGILQKRLQENNVAEYNEIGYVVQVGDCVAQVYGLFQVRSGELVEFDSGQRGIVLNLEEYVVGVVILDNAIGIEEGTLVKRTKKSASIHVNENILGRVINTLGEPIDNAKPIEGKTYEMPLERKAPNILYRQPVSQPLQTGIKAIDAMIPIGRGQRELIIGDRQTGKTSIAIDTIINQKYFFDIGDPVYCIYVAIGQKASTITNIIEHLKVHDALKYTVIVAATASDSATMQCYAPFTGAAIGEFFRDTGKNALVIYDDLSKQAVAYREISLLLQRSPGREAYPGDIFYLHSRLLERAAKINNNDTIASMMNDIPQALNGLVKGGGSLTALPIIETQDANVSAYIPTNVISITDGQIILDKNMFNSGLRPAINVGLSVSRVGSAAQLPSMKKCTSTLKLFQAQYEELASFSKFGSDIDNATQLLLQRGEKNNIILTQQNYNPLQVGEQVVIIYAAINGLLDNIDIQNIKLVEKKILNILNSKYKSILEQLNSGLWDLKLEDEIKKICKEATI